MLQVVTEPSGSLYVCTTIDSIVGDSVFLNSVMVGPYSPLTFKESSSTVLAQYDGNLIKDPLRDRVGDREVFHDQISGRVDLPLFLTRPAKTYSKPSISQTWDVKIGRIWWPFRHIVSPGFDFFEIQACPGFENRLAVCRIAFDGVNYVSVQSVQTTTGQWNNHYVVRWSIESSSASGLKCSQVSVYESLSLSQVERLQPEKVVSTKKVTKAFSLPTPATYPLDTLKECFYWLNESATDPGKFYPALVNQQELVYGDLCQAAIERARTVDVNTLSFMAELRDLKSIFPKFGSWKDPKMWANLYLCYKYGARLTYADIKELLTGIHAAFTKSRDLGAYSAVRSSKLFTGTYKSLPYTDQYRYKISYRPYPNDVMNVVRALDSWGLYPTLTRDWDLIPFSFVVDWVANISSLLERLDARMMADYYDVVAVTRSRKISFTLPVTDLVPNWPGVGTITLSRYTRDTTPILDLPKVRFDGDVDGFSNWAELTSLVIARHK